MAAMPRPRKLRVDGSGAGTGDHLRSGEASELVAVGGCEDFPLFLSSSYTGLFLECTEEIETREESWCLKHRPARAAEVEEHLGCTCRQVRAGITKLGVRSAQRPKQIKDRAAVIQKQVPINNVAGTVDSNCSVRYDEARYVSNPDSLVNVVSYIDAIQEPVLSSTAMNATKIFICATPLQHLTLSTRALQSVWVLSVWVLSGRIIK